jgi:GT2 family glycosyltransferase
MNKIAIVILNWNGYKDTIECLDSLMQSDRSVFDVILIDNGSQDESVIRIEEWFQNQRLGFERVGATEVPLTFDEIKPLNKEGLQEESAQKIALLKSEQNLGFSAGSNLGIRYALLKPYSSILLLNNDTTIEPDALKIMNDALTSNSEWGACVPKIKYYDSPDMIWNAGGHLRPWGGRRYLYANGKDTEALSGMRRITFATGCALAIKSDVLREYGGLCEDFFFGEEDYELSMRYQKKNIQMFAVLDAVVYHKVSISKAELLGHNSLASDFTHHLNRLIHMKRYMSTFQWKVWRFVSLVYIFFLLTIKKRVPLSRKLMKYFQELAKLSTQNSGVNQELFMKSKKILK